MKRISLVKRGLTTRKQPINKSIIPFLKWSQHQLFMPKNFTQREKITGSVGFCIGGLSAYVMYPLGVGFGKIVSDFAGITHYPTYNMMHQFFGINAVIPMIALGAIITKDRFQQLAMSNRLEDRQIFKQNNEIFKKRAVTIAYFLGAFSAIPQSSLTYQAFQNSSTLLQLMTIPAYIGPFLFNSNAEIQLIQKVFDVLDKDKSEIVKKRRIELRFKLSNILKTLSELSDDQLNLLFAQLFDYGKQNAEIQTDEKILRKIKLIFSLSKEGVDKSPSKGVSVIDESTFYGKKLAKILGFTIGAASAYAYYGLGQAGILLLCHLIGMSNPEILIPLGQITGALAYIPNAALGAVATQERFEQIYDSFFGISKRSTASSSWPSLRRFIKGFSIFEGIMSATPLTYIAIEAAMGGAWYQKLLVIPTFIGPASVRSKAVEVLLNRGVDWMDNKFYNTAATKRDNLVKTVLKMDKVLVKMPEEQLSALYKEVTKLNRLQKRINKTTSVTPNPQEFLKESEENLSSECFKK